MNKHPLWPKRLKLSKIFDLKLITTVAVAIVFLALTFLPISVPKSVLAHPGIVTDSFTNKDYIFLEEDVTVDITGEGEVRLWSYGDNITYAGQDYATVQIGTQCWFAEDLNVGTLTNGTNEQGTSCPSSAEIEKYCYDNDEANCTSDGALYQWAQAMCGSTTPGAQGICPTGWHIPTDAEWHTLESYLWDGVTGVCGAGDTGWICSHAGDRLKIASKCFGGVDCADSGFESLLAGLRLTGGSFCNRGRDAYVWSSLQSGGSAWYRRLHSGNATVARSTYFELYGLSVRCLKDLATSQGTLTSTNLLEGVSDVGSVDSFIYTASVPDGTSLKVQFSQDGNTWCDHLGNCDGLHDGILTTGTEIIFSLSDLGWSGPNFYYKTQFTSGSTPTLDEISVSYSAGGEDEAVPEFTTITFIIAAVAGFGIYFVIRRRKDKTTK